MRTFFVAALAATLAGCSSQPPPHAQAAIQCGADTNRYVCFERAAGLPIKLATFRIKSATTGPKSAGAQKAEKSSSAHARHKAHLAGKAAKHHCDRGESRAAGLARSAPTEFAKDDD